MLTRKTTLYFVRKCLFEHLEYMFIYLEGKYNSSKGNLIILGRIMVIDAHLKNVKCVNNVRKKYTVATIRGKIETPHTAWPLTFAFHMKRGGFKIKIVLIIVYFIGNLSFNNLYTFWHLSSDPFM